MAAGDFNGDGRLDLAVNEANGGIQVLLGNGDGTFQDGQQYEAVSTPVALATGDFNQDGNLDLAAADGVANQVSILLGNGDGTFQPPVDYAVGDDPEAIVAADFNGDGRLDVATADAGSSEVSILLGNGDGTFSPAESYPVGDDPDALVAGDFTGNGILDLAVANAGSNTVSILLGNGDGTFQPAVTYPVGSEPVSIVAGAFTATKILDLAVLNEVSLSISVLLGNGDGTFQPATDYVGTSPDYTYALSMVAGDFTGNGIIDLATTSIAYDELSIVMGNGDGTFQAPIDVEPVDPVPYQDGIVAGDFIGNGTLDLVTVSRNTANYQVYLGNGDGTFQPGMINITPLCAERPWRSVTSPVTASSTSPRRSMIPAVSACCWATATVRFRPTPPACHHA